MSFNGSGTFVINSAGQPVVTGTTIASTAFNSLTADLATGLSTTLTKDGQSTPTANIPMGSFKLTGLGNGTASTDAVNLGQIQGAFQGTGYTTTATAAGTTVLTVTSTTNQYFTGATTQTVTLPVVTTLPALGFPFRIVNLSSGTVTVNSSGGNLVATVTANQQVDLTCILLTGTAAASWNVEYSGATAITGTGSTVRATSPTLVTPALGTPTSGVLSACTGLVPATGLSSVTGTGAAVLASAPTFTGKITVNPPNASGAEADAFDYRAYLGAAAAVGMYGRLQATTGVSSAAGIGPDAQTGIGGLAWVFGKDQAGNNRFFDLVAIGGTTATLVTGMTTQGSPSARTYSIGGSKLRVAMTSGTYNIWAGGFQISDGS